MMTGVISGALPTDALRDLPGSGLVPWLASLGRDLRRAVKSTTATKEERELLLLLDYAASKLGDQVLGATDLDDLDDRLDALLDDPDVFHWNALVTRLAVASLRRAPIEADVFTHAFEPVVGATPSRVLANAAPLLDAWLRAQRDGLMQIDAATATAATLAVEAMGPALLTSPSVPAEVAASMSGAFRAGLVTLALVRAFDAATALAPWLALALVERLVAGAREHLRLLAAFPGTTVSADVLPLAERLDLARISERHTRARAQAERTYEDARARIARDAIRVLVEEHDARVASEPE